VPKDFHSRAMHTRQFRTLIYSVVIVLFSAIIAYIWFGGPQNNMIYYIDEFFPFNPHYWVGIDLSAWSWGGNGAGGGGYGQLINMFYYVFVEFFHNILGFGYGWTQYFLYLFLMSFGGVGMMFFVRELKGYGPQYSLAPLASSILYIASAYSIGIYIEFLQIFWFYVAFPWIMLLLMRAVKDARNRLSLFELGLIGILIYFSLASLQWVWLLTEPVFILLYLLFLAYIYRPKVSLFIIIVSFLLVELILLDSPTLIPALINLGRVESEIGLANPSPTSAPWVWVVANSQAEPYFASIGGLSTGWPLASILLADVLAVLSFALAFVTKDRLLRAQALFFSVIALIFIALISGTQPPFGWLFTYIWWHFAPFRAFQTLGMDFGNYLTFIYSALAPLGLLALLEKVKWKEGGTIALLALLIVWLTLGVPSLTFGSAASVPSHPGARVSVSTVDHQVQLASFFMSNTDGSPGRVLILPAQGPIIRTTSYWANDIMGQYGLSVIAGTYMPSFENSLYFALASQIYFNHTTDIAEELAALGVKYVIVQLNAKPSWWPFTQNATTYLKILNSTPGLSYLFTVGNEVVYRVGASYPLIYASPLPANSTAGSAYDFPSVPPIESGLINYTQLSPTEFEVRVNNATGPFLLVLSTTYGDWQVSGVNAAHIMVYNYSNGWIINRTGTYVMRVYYAPQAQANEIIGMQLLAIAISVAFVGCGFVRRKRLTKGLPNSQVKGKFGEGAPSGFGEGGNQ